MSAGFGQRPYKLVFFGLGLVVIIGMLYWGFGGHAPVQISRAANAFPHLSQTSSANRLDDIHNATLGFGKIYAVSLASRTDHRDSLTLAGRVSDFSIDYIDGVPGSSVQDKVLPPDSDRNKLGDGNIGSWRAHMDAIHQVVASNVSSALIVEDDIDWSVDIKEQLREVADGFHALTQPLADTVDSYADPTFGRDSKGEEDHVELDSALRPMTARPIVSPYGDDWDVLWLGHCGARFPTAEQANPKGRYIMHEDYSVPLKKHMILLDPTTKDLYPEHTRIVHHAIGPICTFAYAVSQRGARKIMHQIGLKSFGAAFDNILADFCNDNTCLTTQPELFFHWRKAGNTAGDSDITDWGASSWREKGVSNNIRYSVRLNLEKLVKGQPDLEDQYPDN